MSSTIFSPMPFDLSKLHETLAPWAGVNGDLYERHYRRYRPKWFLPVCRHGAFKRFAEDPFPTDPSGAPDSGILQTWTLPNCDEYLVLITSKCLVCGKVLLEGRLVNPNNNGETSVGILYVRTKDKFTPRPKDIPEKDLLEFYKTDWEFRTTLLADFNKLTIAVAVAAAVFFDKYPSVFYSFIVACFLMILLYPAAYIGQQQIAKKYYKDAGKNLTPTYKSGFDTAAKYLQVIFGAAIVVVLCLMIRAERLVTNEPLQKPAGTNDDLGRTRPFNPPKQTPTQAPAQPQQAPVQAPVKRD
jgi:hypothetical protein